MCLVGRTSIFIDIFSDIHLINVLGSEARVPVRELKACPPSLIFFTPVTFEVRLV